MRVSLMALVAALSLAACSKKAAPQQEAATAEPTAKTPKTSAEDNAFIAAELDDLNNKVKQQQYDAAVGALVGMAQMPKSDAQQAVFRARLRETQDALLQKAQQGDPAAQQSVQMLGRMMTGR